MKDILNCYYQSICYNKNIIFAKVIIIFFLVLWIIKNINFQIKNQNPLIKIIHQVKIDSKHTIVAVDIQNIRFILGVTLHNIRTLYTLDNVKINPYKYDIQKFRVSFLINIIYKFFIFLFLLFYSPNACSAGYSEITKHIFLHNIYNWSFSIQFFLIMLSVTLISVFFLMTTSFTRIFIVLSLLRNALGMPSLPPNQLLISIAVCLTCFVMYPTYHRVYQEAYLPFYAHYIAFDEACIKALRPIYDFMVHQTRTADLIVFSKLSHVPLFLKNNFVPIKILIPSFIMSELKTAFQIGFTIFIPFLIIDVFIATVLMSLGMTMIAPNTISLPIKLILFVMVDGWQLIFSSLVKSFH